jgi:hypothetical protein
VVIGGHRLPLSVALPGGRADVASPSRSLRYGSIRDTVVKGVAMLWIVIPVAVLVIGGVIAFLFGPTIKALFGPDFEPSPKDSASVENAIMNRMVDGGQ